MYLKSITLKGFKSFGDPTTIELEPGVTVVVGPNGSGKSNVVDAVAWVLGAQGPRVVRSTKMDDVIFAGTSRRAALGRAEVSLTIDNSAKRLPIDFNDVTVTRTLFRSGESEYALNGTPCRLLDIQELFSDTGVGRQQHVIIGQGQLDSVLQARPEDRRMIIEEAAGVLKFRRRRERAERRLESSEASLARLQDLLREVRRQLKPLERQAGAAHRSQELATELRGLRLYLSGQELGALSSRIGAIDAEISSLQENSEAAKSALAELDASLAAVQVELGEQAAEELLPHVGRAERLSERTRGLRALIDERMRSLVALDAALDTNPLLRLEAELVLIREDLAQVDEGARQLAPEWDALSEEEERAAQSEQVHARQFGAALSVEPFEATIEARQVCAARRAKLAQKREQHVRSAERAESLGRRRAELTELAQSLGDASLATGLESDAATLRRDEFEREVAVAEEIAKNAAEAVFDALGSHHETAARVHSLEAALDDVRARSGIEALAGIGGVLGTLLEVVEVDDRAALAFEAALEGSLDAVVVTPGALRDAIAQLRTRGGGTVLGFAARGREAGPAPAGSTPLREHVTVRDSAVSNLLDALLADVFFCESGFDRALELATENPALTFVTASGDRLSPMGWRVGVGRQGATRAALQSATARAESARAQLEVVTASDAVAQQDLAARRNELAEADRVADRLRTGRERTIASHNDALFDLERVTTEEGAARAEQDTTRSELEAISTELRGAEDQLALLEEGEAEALAKVGEATSARRVLDERSRALSALRRDLEVRAASLEERRRLLLEREQNCTKELAERRAARASVLEHRGAHLADEEILARVGLALERVASRLGLLESLLRAAHGARVDASREQLDRLASIRARREETEHHLAAIGERRQRQEIDGAEARVRHEAAVDMLLRDLEAVPEEAFAASVPALPDGVDAPTRAQQVDRELRLLGPVNPLAREELLALEERQAFLEEQLADVRTARRELNEIIVAVDGEIVSAFQSAYEDVARHFASLFETLFPGGSGRLDLSAPDDLLTTGVEIEARPSGRNVRRLSLLSGGERALVALAFLFAVFRSRPSPFYMMDEVEAALDEVNLRRFLALVDEFRDEAQLIIVSHQKKTMEIADLLYGVTMQAEGCSKVVSERLRDVGQQNPTPEPAAAVADA